MKQAIYIFSLYIGAVIFFTLYVFGETADLSFMFASFAALVTLAAIWMANKRSGRNWRRKINSSRP